MPAPLLPSGPALSAADEYNPLRRLGLAVACFFLFLRFGYLHEYLAYVAGSSFYLLFLSSTLVAGAAIFSGGVRRLLEARQARWWCAFALWLAVTVPFSNWQLSSAKMVLSYVQVPLTVMLITGGLAVTLTECYRLMSSLAAASVVSVAITFLLGWQGENRLGMKFGTMGNTNDIPPHLLFVLPFLFFFLMRTKVWLFKLVAAATLLAGLVGYMRTGSRGGLISLVVVALYLLLVAPMWARFVMGLALPLVAVGVFALLPAELRVRYGTLPGADEDAPQAQDAAGSSITRRYLLEKSISYTLEHPIFGVGPGEFSDVEGSRSGESGHRGLWQGTHNAYTQVSSEAGIPGVIIYLGAIISTFRLLRSLKARCRMHPELKQAGLAASCMMLSMVGFCTAIMFLTLAYVFYLPAMTGFAIILDRAVRRESAVLSQPRTNASAGGVAGATLGRNLPGRA